MTVMRFAIDSILDTRGGAATRSDLLGVISRNQLDDEVARGHLIAIFPRVYCRPWDVDEPAVRDRAALASVGSPVALSHLSALRYFDLPAPPEDDTVHCTVPVGRHPWADQRDLAVHRTRVATRVRRIDGLVVVDPAVAVVRSWPMLPLRDRRDPAIHAVRSGLLGTADLREAAGRTTGMRGRRQLLTLIEQLEAGCESELELWGLTHVFDVPGLRHGVRQFELPTPAAHYRLDLAYLDEQVAVELDGARWHSTRAARERDMRRDAALAATGWVTLRFSFDRLHDDVAGCRRDTLAVLAGRRLRRGA